MSNQSIPQERRSNPVELPYHRLPGGTAYTFQARLEEQEKVKGEEDTESREQAADLGTVFVWLTNQQWERLAASRVA